MSEIFLPYDPRQDDPQAAMVVQKNLEALIGFFTTGLANGDTLIWDAAANRFVAGAPAPGDFTGKIVLAALRNAPTGYLKCDGAAYSRTTYAALFAAIVPSLGTFTVTIASPGVITLNGHGLVIGDKVFFTTTGALPTGLSANTRYHVVSTTANTFTVSATEGGAAINTSGTQSGTHTLRFCPYGLGDGSTTFNVPDGPGRVFAVVAGASGHSDIRALGQSDPESIGDRRPKHKTSITDPAHSHNYNQIVGGPANIQGGGDFTGQQSATTSQTTGITAGPQTNVPTDQPAWLGVNAFIKT